MDQQQGVTENPYSESELHERRRAYHAAGRSCTGQSIRYFRWLLKTARCNEEKEFLKQTIISLCEFYFQPH